jgi:hypothetical protein
MTSIEYRSNFYIIDELFIQMCNTYLDDPSNNIPRTCKYRLRAAEYGRRISVGRFSSEDQYPVFIINKSDLKSQLREEIEKLANEDLSTLDDIIDEVIYCLYDSSDRHLRLIYFRYIQGRRFRWKLEE